MSHDAPQPLRVVTYNVHGCVGWDGQRSERRIAEVLAALQPDIIGLQELDLGRKRSQGVDQAGLIAAQLGFERHFHPAMQVADEHYGDAILSRWPLTLRRADSLPTRKALLFHENRGALWVESATPHGRWHVFNTHLGLGVAERLVQAEALAGEGWVGAVPAGEPLVLLGDFNSLPGSLARRALLRTLADASQSGGARGRNAATFPTYLPLLALDYVFINAAVEARGVAVCKSPLARVASDHFPLLAELSLPSAPGLC